MKRILLMVGAMIVLSSLGVAAPLCSAVVSGTNVTTLNGGGGCTLDGLTFSNFQVSGGPTAEVDLMGASLAANIATLNFNPNLGAGTTGGSLTDLHFAYTVTGLALGAGLDNTSSINASINEINCLTSSSTTGCVGTQIWNTLALSGQFTFCNGNSPGGTGTNATCAYGAGQSLFYVFKDISIGDPAASHNTSFNELYTVSVPEPMTLSLMGLGLLGLGFASRKFKK